MKRHRALGSGDEAAHLYTALTLDRSETDEIQGEMSNHGEVMRGVPRACPHLIIAKGDIHAPVQSGGKLEI